MARFAFIPRTLTSIGAPVRYDVVEGISGSNAGGRCVGQVMYDGVRNAWGFKINEKLPHISTGGADAAEITAFILSLSVPTDLIDEG